VGTDLKEGKVTLPLIHTLKLTNEKEKTSIKKVLDKNKVTIKDFERVRNIILKYGGIDYTSTIAKQYIDTAKNFLNIFQTSPYKNALLSLADYMLKREM
jgi:octaprenyl-diphosphate synthase